MSEPIEEIAAGHGLPTAVVFSSVNALHFSFYKVFEGAPINRIFVRDPFDCWYQKGVSDQIASVEALAETLRARVRALGSEHVLTFGSSMGGYASLLFGRLLPATTICAIAPQTIIDPRLPHTPGERFDGPNFDLAPLLAKGFGDSTVMVFLGSADFVDIYNVARVDWGQAAVYPVAGQDHLCAHHLARAGVFRRLIAQFAQGEPFSFDGALDARCFDPVIAALIAHTVEAFYLDGGADPLRATQAILALEPDWPAPHFMLAQILNARGAQEEALAAAASATRLGPNSILFADFYASLVKSLERWDEAVTAYERCLVLRPKHYAALCALGEMLARAGQRQRAIEYLNQAVAIRPRLNRAQKVLQMLDREDAAKAA